MGDFTILVAKQSSTQNGATNGRQAVGTTPFQASRSADWYRPFFKGFGVLGRAVYNGPDNLDAANTQQMPAWTRFDVGARYTFDRTGDGKPATLRANVTNLFHANYWIATTSYFVQN